jgi:hypothetical protein
LVLLALSSATAAEVWLKKSFSESLLWAIVAEADEAAEVEEGGLGSGAALTKAAKSLLLPVLEGGADAEEEGGATSDKPEREWKVVSSLNSLGFHKCTVKVILHTICLS